MSLIKTNDLQRVFEKLDKNGDGLVSLEELNWLLEKIGVQISLDELESLVGKSSLDLNEFFSFYGSISSKQSNTSGSTSNEVVVVEEEEEENEESDHDKAFEVFNLNGDGFISCDELQKVLSRLGLWAAVGGASSFRVLDMVIISAKDLKQVNHFFKMDVFALASVQGYNNHLYNSLQKAPIDKDGGSNPIWNFPMKFLIDVVAAENYCLTLVIKLKADGSFGDKDIGEVHVPIKELLDKYGASNDEMHASYDVRTTRAGKFKGVLDFSFKFGDTVAPALGSSVAAPPTPGGYPYPLAPGYGGYPLLQMQPQEETKMGKKFAEKLGAFLCGFVRIATADAIFDNI